MKQRGAKWTEKILIQKHLENKIQLPGMVPVKKPVKKNAVAAVKKKSKYNNVKTIVDGIPFDSIKEANRYRELKLLKQKGEIARLELQPVYKLIINNVLICKYKADFRYLQRKEPELYAGNPLSKNKTVYNSVSLVIEDVKGMKTPVYRLKKKLMKAIYNIEIKET